MFWAEYHVYIERGEQNFMGVIDLLITRSRECPRPINSVHKNWKLPTAVCKCTRQKQIMVKLYFFKCGSFKHLWEDKTVEYI